MDKEKNKTGWGRSYYNKEGKMEKETLSDKIIAGEPQEGLRVDIEDVKEHIKNIIIWCHQNNTIPLKNSGLSLATMDGGWVNVLELLDKFNREFGGKLI